MLFSTKELCGRVILTALVLAVVSAGCLGYSGGSGTTEDPYQIATKADLLALAGDPNDYSRCFILTTDIDLASETFTRALIAPDMNNTQPGPQWTMFTGVFDGNYHVIHRLIISASAQNYVGMFGLLGTGGQVKNLGLEGVAINGHGYVGGLVGANGEIGYGGGIITSCYATGEVSGGDYVGGLVGSNYGVITSSCATGAVSDTDSDSAVGGLVGLNDGYITSCYATGMVSGNGNICGGLVGENPGDITFCYAIGVVRSKSNYYHPLVGGLVGSDSMRHDVRYDPGTIAFSFWDTQTSGLNIGVGSGSQTGVAGKTTAQMKTLSTFTDSGWDFSATDGDPADWKMPNTAGYPLLSWQQDQQDQMPILTVIANPATGGTVTGGGTFPADSQQTISATANTGWVFTGWNDGNTSASRTVTVPAGGVSYIANFITTGSIVAWGANEYGQCTVSSPNTGFMAIAVGENHSLGLKTDGSIVAWGYSHYGQCTVPSPNTGFTAIAVGENHSLGLKTDGSIVAWGATGAVPSPNTGFTAIAVGTIHSLGLKTDGSIVAWGATGAVPSPNTSFTAIAAGGWHSLGLKTDGSIVAWGDNWAGQCTVPSPNTDFTAIAVGEYHSLGLKTDGSIVAWGNNEDGQCTVPSPNTGFVAIAAGYHHSLGLKTDGSIVAWGDNDWGQCTVPSPNTGFTAIAAGRAHSLGLWGQLATLTVVANPANGGTVSGGGTFAIGSQQAIIATANSGWIFTGWNDGNTSTPRTVMVPVGGTSYTANFQQQSDTFTITSMSVKAGKRTPNSPADSFVIVGTSFDLDASAVPTQTDTIDFAFFNQGETEPCFEGSMPFDPVKFNKGKYVGKNVHYTFSFDVNKHTFSLSGKQVYLCGLGSPLRLEITIGDVLLSGVAYVDMPLELMMGDSDALRVDKATVKAGKGGMDSLTASGMITVADPNVNLTQQAVTIQWGAVEVVIPASRFVRVGNKHKFVYTRPKGSALPNATITFDWETGRFTMAIKTSGLATQQRPLTFNVRFATYDESCAVN